MKPFGRKLQDRQPQGNHKVETQNNGDMRVRKSRVNREMAANKNTEIKGRCLQIKKIVFEA